MLMASLDFVGIHARSATGLLTMNISGFQAQREKVVSVSLSVHVAAPDWNPGPSEPTLLIPTLLSDTQE